MSASSSSPRAWAASTSAAADSRSPPSRARRPHRRRRGRRSRRACASCRPAGRRAPPAGAGSAPRSWSRWSAAHRAARLARASKPRSLSSRSRSTRSPRPLRAMRMVIERSTQVTGRVLIRRSTVGAQQLELPDDEVAGDRHDPGDVGVEPAMPGVDDRVSSLAFSGSTFVELVDQQDHGPARRLDQAEHRRRRDARRRHLAHDQHADDAQQRALAAPVDGAQHGQARAVERGVVGVGEDDPQRDGQGAVVAEHDEPPDLRDQVADQRGAVDRVGPGLDLRQLDRPALSAVAARRRRRARLTAPSSTRDPHAEPLRLSLAHPLVFVRAAARRGARPRPRTRPACRPSAGGIDAKSVLIGIEILRLDVPNTTEVGSMSAMVMPRLASSASQPRSIIAALSNAAACAGSRRPALAAPNSRMAALISASRPCPGGAVRTPSTTMATYRPVGRPLVDRGPWSWRLAAARRCGSGGICTTTESTSPAISLERTGTGSATAAKIGAAT